MTRVSDGDGRGWQKRNKEKYFGSGSGAYCHTVDVKDIEFKLGIGASHLLHQPAKQDGYIGDVTAFEDLIVLFSWLILNWLLSTSQLMPRGWSHQMTGHSIKQV